MDISAPPRSAATDLLLYEGALTLTCEDRKEQGKGWVRLEWHPAPRISFEIRLGAPSSIGTKDDAQLALGDGGAAIEAWITTERVEFTVDQEGGYSNKIGGKIAVAAIVGTPGEVVAIEFAGVNLPPLDQPRIVIDLDSWRLTLDSSAEKPPENSFRVTHGGRLERSDGKTFGVDLGLGTLDRMQRALSFGVGNWCAFALPTGISKANGRCWQRWCHVHVDPYTDGHSWLPRRPSRAESIEELLAKFLSACETPLWKDTLFRAIHWYVEVAQSDSMEVPGVLCQVALELLAWVSLVEDRKIVSSQGFDQLPASDKLRLWFSSVGIPLAVPPSEAPLIEAMKARRWIDGPHLLTELRNRLVHPKKREELEQLEGQARVDAIGLGRWYLELSVLAAIGYRGKHWNRVIGEYEAVPWAK